MTDWTTDTEYRQGQIDALKELLKETHATRTQGDILWAAYNARGIPKAVVDEAREVVRDND